MHDAGAVRTVESAANFRPMGSGSAFSITRLPDYPITQFLERNIPVFLGRVLVAFVL
jgi:hypothetical protein